MSNWAAYLTKGVHSFPIYHICDKADYLHQLNTSDSYVPPTFDIDGRFVHCTAIMESLIFVGNHFYKSTKGEWICLKIEPSLLESKLVYEAAAGVGNIAASDHRGDQTFPHVYGPINCSAVVDIYPVIRGEDGTFLRIQT